MTIFRFSLLALVGLLTATGVSAQRGPAGGWSLAFSPSENLHKLVYSDEGEGGLYFRCEPRSGSVRMLHNIEGVDVRKYVPKVEWGGVRVTGPYEVEWEDYGGGVYFFDMVFSSENKVLQLLPYGGAVNIDLKIYPIKTEDEIILIREFLRICEK